MSLQMHELIQSMAREITREEFNMPGNRSGLRLSSEFYDALNKNKVTEEVEVLVLLLKNNGQNIPIDGKAFTLMKNLRILKIYFQQYWQPFAVKLSGTLDFLSNELRWFCWHGCPFKYLPSNSYPENIVAIDLSYSHIKQLWTAPKCLRRLKVMNLSHCCNLITTPDFSEIINLEELSLEGCVNLVSIHPSIGMLKRLVVLNLRDCKRLQNFPSRVEMDALQVLDLTGCLKVDQLPEALGRIKSITELHVDRTAITELPSFVSSLINLESLSFGGQGKIQPRWWTSITGHFGLLSKQQHPQRSVWSSLTGLHMLKSLNFSYCKLEQVPDAIGGLSCLKDLDLKGNNFTSLPGCLSQLSHLKELKLNGCKKLEVLPELPPSLDYINAYHCTSLREVTGSSKEPFRKRLHVFINCPKLLTSQTNRCEFFSLPRRAFDYLNIVYHGNSIPEWFINRSTGNHVKVELPSDWCFNKFRGFGTCVVFKCKKLPKFEEYSVKNFDGASLMTECYIPYLKEFWKDEMIEIHESYVIWLHYSSKIWKWKETKNFVTFCFGDEDEDFEVKEMGVRLVYDEDIEQETDVSMLQGLSTQTRHGGMLGLTGGVNAYLYIGRGSPIENLCL